MPAPAGFFIQQKQLTEIELSASLLTADRIRRKLCCGQSA
jgi:hypothetical protein